MELMDRYHAILLAGPTGSGKTPLGDLLESRSLQGKRCFHFDFGENLRSIAVKNTETLDPKEVEIVTRSLKTGSLLNDEHFMIARKILLAFLEKRKVGKNDLVILNGLPRHVGQAEDVDSMLDVRAVVYLHCTLETVFKRIASNAGGDRTSRIDDDIRSIKSKLETLQTGRFR